jgi:alanine racemase
LEKISAFKDKFVNCITFNIRPNLSNFDKLSLRDETILISARSFQFEEIVYLLEEKTHETVLEINLNAISYNLNFFKSKLKPSVKIMVMVKHSVTGMVV